MTSFQLMDLYVNTAQICFEFGWKQSPWDLATEPEWWTLSEVWNPWRNRHARHLLHQACCNLQRRHHPGSNTDPQYLYCFEVYLISLPLLRLYFLSRSFKQPISNSWLPCHCQHCSFLPWLNHAATRDGTWLCPHSIFGHDLSSLLLVLRRLIRCCYYWC